MDEERLRLVVAEAELPDETHAAVVLEPNVSPLEFPPIIAVWADYAHDRCPVCDQPVQREIASVPVTLHQGEVVPLHERQCGCGEWLGIGWEQPDGTGPGGEITPEDVVRTAIELRSQLLAERAERVI